MKNVMGALLLAAATAAPAQAERSLLIQGSLTEQGELQLRYQPPPGVQELPFAKLQEHGLAAWRKQLQLQPDACTELLPSALRLRPGCVAATLTIRPQTLQAYAVYQPAEPLSDGQGVLLHTGHYLVLLPDTALHWEWRAPWVAEGGTLRAQGPVVRQLSAEQVNQALAQQAREGSLPEQLGLWDYLLLGRSELQRAPGAVLDGRLGAERVHQLRQLLAQIHADYAQAYGDAPPGGLVVAVASELRGYHGDTTVGPMMRLRLPMNAAALSQADLQYFLAHETAHWWNSGLYSSDELRPWLHEGHAEWLAHVQQRPHHPQADWNARVERALNACLRLRAGQVAAGLPTGRKSREDYDCGMSLFLTAQALRAQRQPDASRGLQGLASLHAGAARLTVERLLEWADGPLANPAEGAFGRLLLDPEQEFSTGLSELLQRLGVARAERLQSSEALGLADRQARAGDLLADLMRADCAGAVGFWTLDDGFKLDPRLSCTRLPREGKVIALQGQSLLERPLEAQAAAAAACREGASVQLSLQGGGTVVLNCPQGWARERPQWQLRLLPGAHQLIGL